MRPPGMEQDMRQSMVATAAMQLFMRTLQATNMELQQMAAQAVAANPTLEESEPTVSPESFTPTDTELSVFRLDSVTEAPSLSRHLEEQLRRSALPPATEAAALTLLQHLSPRGFFEEAPTTIAEQEHIPNRHLKAALAAIRDLDPPGVGAEDLRDSLMLQLKRLGEEDGLPMQLLREHWEALVQHRYAEAARKLGTEEYRVTDAAARIARLNPNPGAGFAPEERMIFQPDIVVERDGDELTVQLTGENVPKLALSAAYREMMAEQADKKEVRQYLSHCFREGRDLIRAIEQRQQTILKVAQAIVARQRDFFLRGEQHLRPMKMEDIAADTELHTSTVSRAVNGKYLRYNRKLTELRRFFTTALPAAGDTAVSPETIKARIREHIAAESPAKPLSDARLESLLAADGMPVARRTIAKYREQMKILPAHLRRKG